MRAALPGFFLLLIGCAEQNIDLAAQPESGDADTGAAFESLSLRVDIYPSDANSGLLPQSVQLDSEDGTRDLSLRLNRSISVAGVVSGYVSTPTARATVPGEDATISAAVTLVQDDSVAGSAVVTDTDGAFSFEVPPGEGYVLSVVPVDPTLLPFQVWTDQVLERDLSFSASELALGYGDPVYGEVRTSSGKGVRGARVSLLDPTTGIAGASTETDSGGWYMLRSLPGDWELMVEGEAGSYVPASTHEVTVVEGEGAQVDVDVGALTPVAVRGKVVDSLGGAVGDVQIRFSATELAEATGSLDIETDTDQNGIFIVQLLPGSWRAEFLPSYDMLLSPIAMTLDVGSEMVVLTDDVQLPELVPLLAKIVDANGEPVADVQVSAVERGFDGHSYVGTSDSSGLVSLTLPQVPLEFTLIPPNADAAITRVLGDAPWEEPPDLTLATGQPVDGTVLSDDGPVAYAIVELRNPNTGALYGSTITDDEGRFAVQVAW